jgi:hypothetical protein
MLQVKRLPEDPKLFEHLLLTRAIAVITRQPESVQLPSRECVQSLLTKDEIETAIENAAYCAGEFVRRLKENGNSLTQTNQAVDTIKISVKEWREQYFGGQIQ